MTRLEPTLSDLDAHAFLLTLARRDRSVVGRPPGIGDDVAVVSIGREKIVLKTDPTVESLHFETGFRDARAIAKKAIGRPCSDFAAAFARPKFILASVEFTKNTSAAFAKNLLARLYQSSKDAGARLVGGHTAFTGEKLAIHVTVAGELLKQPIGRSGARAGDVLLATGSFGGSRAGKHLHFKPRLAEASALAAGGACPRASIDVSDGLSLDLQRLADASKVKIVVNRDSIPVSKDASRMSKGNADAALERALADGEDYELILAYSPRDAARALTIARRRRFALTTIGRVERGRGVYLEMPDGFLSKLEPKGFVQRSVRRAATNTDENAPIRYDFTRPRRS